MGVNATPQQPAARVRVFGGSDYKALQAKAEAGGLVNLDDSLLFGGTEKDGSKPGTSVPPLDASFSTYLGEQLEDFTASPIKGGFHPTAHLSDADVARRFYRDTWCQTVLGLSLFKLGNLSAEALAADDALHIADAEQASRHPPELNDLGRQVTYLNQRIEYLSRKLSALAATDINSAKTEAYQQKSSPSPERVSASTHRSHRSAVIDLKSFTASESKEKRIATLDTLSTAL